MAQQREWKPRKSGFSIGRLTFFPPSSGELYYLRILLTNKKGCTDYQSIKIVNKVTYNTYQEDCYAMGYWLMIKNLLMQLKNLATLLLHIN